jgi:hypothetical protein
MSATYGTVFEFLLGSTGGATTESPGYVWLSEQLELQSPDSPGAKMAMLRASDAVVHISVAVVCIANLCGAPSVSATGD